MVSSGRHQTGAASDVVLKSAFPELLSAGASGGPPPLDWWPTQINRLGDGGPLGPHLVERGGIQIERRRRALADEAVHGKHFNGEKHLFGSGKAEKIHDPDGDLMETNLSLTFQGDFCVSMIGRGALRCKKRDLRTSKDAEACKIAVQRRWSKWS